MTRARAIEHATRHYDDGGFETDLARRVAIPSTSQDPAFAEHLEVALVDRRDRDAADLHSQVPGQVLRVVDAVVRGERTRHQQAEDADNHTAQAPIGPGIFRMDHRH